MMDDDYIYMRVFLKCATEFNNSLLLCETCGVHE